MAQRHARQGRNKRRGGIYELGQQDWQNRQQRLRRWVTQNQNVAVYQGPDGKWTLLRVEAYLDAGILGCFRFSVQRTIAESVLGL